MALAAGLVVALGARASAQTPDRAVLPAPPEARLQAQTARLGETVTYRAWVLKYPGYPSMEVVPPVSDEALAWGKVRASMRVAREAQAPRAGRPPAMRDPDTLMAEATVQVFRIGVVQIPGIAFQTRDSVDRKIFRAPTTSLLVRSILPSDSTDDLKPVRGPLGAPWWERVPWAWVVVGVLALAAAVVVWLRLRKRKPLAPVRVAPVPRPLLDPATVALAELQALRGLHLPDHGRFAEHAFSLSKIARVFLEATIHTPLPGDTSSELLAHLEATQELAADDIDRLRGLLRAWDQVKFARAPFTIDEARRCENSVEMLIRRVAPPRTPPGTSPVTPPAAPPATPSLEEVA